MKKENITIVPTFAGEGATYRKVFMVYAGEKYICRFSDLEAAKRAYPGAMVEE